MQLEEAEARDALKLSKCYTAESRAERGSCRRMGTGAGVAQTPKFDGFTSWAVFRRQFQTVEEHNGWTSDDKVAHLIAALNEPAAHILHSVPIGARYEEVTAALENRYGDHPMEAFHAQLSRNHKDGESTQKFATLIDHLAHCA